MRVPMPHVNSQAHPIAKKRHQLTLLDSSTASLVVVLRNYKECVTRQLQLTTGWSGRLDVQDAHVASLLQDYWQIVKMFAEWRTDKHLLYYEDLVEAPRETAVDLLQFMRVTAPEAQVQEFFAKYSWHKDNSLAALVDLFRNPRREFVFTFKSA